MKTLITIIIIAAACAMSAAAQDKPAAPAGEKPADKPAAAPAVEAEGNVSGSIDLGYRWTTVGGSYSAYRSIVNLGEGPKLLNSDLTFVNPSHRFFDVMHVRATGWGDDPYETFHVDARKSRLYDFTADYRDFAYFNALPSFADPLLSRGIILNEQSFDLRRQLGNFELDLFPGRFLTPYFSYGLDSSSGTGVSNFVSDQNEYPLPAKTRDLTNIYRAGVRIIRPRYHATLETGGTIFEDDQSLYDSSKNLGNRNTNYFGQQLYLSSLATATAVRGSSVFERANVAASPANWMDVSGQFVFSQPETSTNYQQAISGNFFSQSSLLFYTNQQFLLTSAAKLPHTLGNVEVEVRPFRRLRIVESLLTDRLHSAGNGGVYSSKIADNYNQQEIDFIYDAGAHLTLRGGYRYVWGDAHDSILPATDLANSEVESVRRHVGIGAATYRPNAKLSLTASIEGGGSDGVYFRTSLYNYQRARLQARYQLSTELSVAADWSLLQNQNPSAGVNARFLSSQESVSLFWIPAGGKTWDVLATYARGDLHSDINYLSPQDLRPQLSHYIEDVHTGTGLFSFHLPGGAKFSAGGSFAVISGSRATSYFQPLGRVLAPTGKHTSFFAEWRYYGYGESQYLYEGFRSNLVTAGVRFTK